MTERDNKALAYAEAVFGDGELDPLVLMNATMSWPEPPDIDPRWTKKVAGLCEVVTAYAKRLKIEKSMAEAMERLDKSTAPCGHNAQYLYSPDGVGKNIICLRCNYERRAGLTVAPAPDQTSRINELEAFVRDCRDMWDCDSDGHRYNTGCRCCKAEALLPKESA